MRVFQLSEDKQSLIFKCPRCNEEAIKSIAEIEEEAEESVADSALDDATGS